MWIFRGAFVSVNPQVRAQRRPSLSRELPKLAGNAKDGVLHQGNVSWGCSTPQGLINPRMNEVLEERGLKVSSHSTQ